MAKFKPRFRRLLFIDGRIRQGGYPNCGTLSREYAGTPLYSTLDAVFKKLACLLPDDTRVSAGCCHEVPTPWCLRRKIWSWT